MVLEAGWRLFAAASTAGADASALPMISYLRGYGDLKAAYAFVNPVIRVQDGCVGDRGEAACSGLSGIVVYDFRFLPEGSSTVTKVCWNAFFTFPTPEGVRHTGGGSTLLSPLPTTNCWRRGGEIQCHRSPYFVL